NTFPANMRDPTPLQMVPVPSPRDIARVSKSLGILIVALAPDITILLVGWCIAQVLFNALLAAVVAVLPDQVPIGQRGLISVILGVGMPIASVSATFLVKLFTGNQLAMFLVPS